MQQTHTVCCQGWKKRHPGALTCEGEAGSSQALGEIISQGLSLFFLSLQPYAPNPARMEASVCSRISASVPLAGGGSTVTWVRLLASLPPTVALGAWPCPIPSANLLSLTRCG